jgi:MFS family permease
MSDQLNEYESFIEKNRRWNFFANAADLTSVNLAQAFIFSTTILTLYASYLTSSAVLIGLIPAIQQVGYLLPQLLSANRIERLERKKPFVVKISVLERLPYFFVTLGIFFIPGAPGWISYLILAFSIGIATGAAGIATPAWKAMLGKIIDPNRRGALFAFGLSAGGFLGIGGTFLARWFLNHYQYPVSFAMCFLLSFIFQAVSWLFLTLNREPAKPPERENISHIDYFRQLPRIIKANPNFRFYLIAMLFIIIGQMAVSFYIVYARHTFAVTDGFAANLTLVALLSQSIATPILGVLGDKMGHKFLTELSCLFSIAALAVMLVLPSVTWIYLVFLLLNVGTSGLKISQGVISMEFSPEGQLPTFVALSGTLLGIPTFFAPIIGGAILDVFGYTPLFATALIFSIFGVLVLRQKVREPRVRRRR